VYEINFKVSFLRRKFHSFLVDYEKGNMGGRALGAKAKLACEPGYKRLLGDEEIICGSNAVGTHGIWYNKNSLSYATLLYCVLDDEFCPAVTLEEGSGGVIILNEGRKLGDRYMRGCKAGFRQVAGDAEARCAEEGTWKVGNRNALQIECAFIEECPKFQNKRNDSKY
jgi:hypothetical protein